MEPKNTSRYVKNYASCKKCQIARLFLLRNENVEFLNFWKICKRKSESSQAEKLDSNVYCVQGGCYQIKLLQV